MSQQQFNLDSWTNSNYLQCNRNNALAVFRARVDVLGRAAVIIRAYAHLDKAMVAIATPISQYLIKVARSRLAEKMATTSTVILTPPSSQLMSIIIVQVT